MKINMNMVVAGALALGLVACSSNDENLAAKDKVLQEKQEQMDTLQRQLAANESTRLVMQRQLDEANARNARPTTVGSTLRNDNPLVMTDERVANTPPARPDTPPTKRPSRTTPRINDKSVTTSDRDGATVFCLSGGFAPGSSTLNKDGEAALGKVAAELKKSKGSISIEGHTDAQPLTGKNKDRYRNNTNLSLARANAVKEWLETKAKIADSRITVHGYGEKKPLEKGSSKEANAKNRRIDIVLDG